MQFTAPWSTLVRIISVADSAILLGVVLVVGRRLPPGSWLWLLSVAGPLVVLAGSMLFTVLGYRLEPTRLLVRRLLLWTAIDLEGLRAARHEPAATERSLRLFGKGGLFAIAGLFTNSKLGRYRAFATDPARAVVLELEGRSTIVITPFPEESAAGLRELRPGLPAEEPG